MFTSIFYLLKKLPTTVWMIIIIILLGLSLFFAYNKIQEQSKEIERTTNNMYNIVSKLDSTVTKNGEIVYHTNALSVKVNELKNLNSELVNEIKDMGIKLKNIKSVTNINHQYHITYDSIFPEQTQTTEITKNKFEYNFKDSLNGFQFKSDINIPNDLFLSVFKNEPISVNSYPYLSNFNAKITDSLIIVPEYEYKRSWIFWKKLIGIKVHIKSDNEFFHLDRVQHFEIVK